MNETPPENVPPIVIEGLSAGYGRELEKLEQVLQKISSVTQEAK